MTKREEDGAHAGSSLDCPALALDLPPLIAVPGVEDGLEPVLGEVEGILGGL